MAGSREAAIKAWRTMRERGINPAASRRGKPLTEAQRAALAKARRARRKRKG